MFIFCHSFDFLSVSLENFGKKRRRNHQLFCLGLIENLKECRIFVVVVDWKYVRLQPNQIKKTKKKKQK